MYLAQWGCLSLTWKCLQRLKLQLLVLISAAYGAAVTVPPTTCVVVLFLSSLAIPLHNSSTLPAADICASQHLENSAFEYNPIPVIVLLSLSSSATHPHTNTHRLNSTPCLNRREEKWALRFQSVHIRRRIRRCEYWFDLIELICHCNASQ